MKFQGPCLPHCYKKYSATLFILGILLGFIIYKITKRKEANSRRNSFNNLNIGIF